MRRLVPAVLGAGLLYLAWRIVTQNDAPVAVDYLLGGVELPVWQALLSAFVCGAFLVGLFTFYHVARTGLVVRRYRKKLASLEAEVHQLRNLPLSPGSLPDVLPDALPDAPPDLAKRREPAHEDPQAHLERGGARGRKS